MSQTTKFTYEYVSNLIAEKGCKLITKQYINAKQELEIECACGNHYTTNLDSFTNKNRIMCKECYRKKQSKSMSLSYDDVKSYVESQGCRLISTEYINSGQKLVYECSCREETFERTFNKFKSRGQTRCKKCVGITDWTIDVIRKYVEDKSCKLLSDDSKYKDRKTKLLFECKCGNNFTTDFHTFLNLNKHHCDECGQKNQAQKKRKGIDYLKKYVKENSESKLLSTGYTSYHLPLEFECKCGNPFKTSFVGFRNGKTLCDECSGGSSKSEVRAEKFLIENNLFFDKQYKFNDLYGGNKKRHPLFFDFAILNNDGELICLLELDGEQHFKPIKIFGGIEKFKQTQKRDKMKNDYCESNNIKLLRIGYMDFDKIEDILKENFL